MATGNRVSSSVRDLAVDAMIRAALGAPDITVAYRAGVESLLRRAEEANVLGDIRSLEFEAEVRRRVTVAMTHVEAGVRSGLTQFQLDTLRLLVGAVETRRDSVRQIFDQVWVDEARCRAIDLYQYGEGFFVRVGPSGPMADHGNDHGLEDEDEDEEMEDMEEVEVVVVEDEEEGASRPMADHESDRGQEETDGKTDTEESEEESGSEDSSSEDGDDAAGAGVVVDSLRPWVCRRCPNHRGVMHLSSLVRHMAMVHNVVGFRPRQ
ncbi:hypothetical protein A1O3_05624 [Capronia epimyces CBS 606.96]|uniref:Uncharacterized protein n=1 Tax=Capronia epimyces CBS 606.96 TaxID=1182542 RepID=W9YRQ0_9EURO|nr:uncharacterized protein A1O3_05624 [Capronia epimyces CBS 606.96]EXJ84949.1 hypothetical protein A1O3_05624 [Capronia epimyces CBS 606.96]